MALTEDECAKILLIRSVEECNDNAFPADILTDAVKKAGDEVRGVDWFLKRASHLFENLQASYRSIIHLAKLPDPWLLSICVLALFFGFATNLLGPADKIHVIRNPVVFFVVWNLFIYLALIVFLFFGKLPRSSHSQAKIVLPKGSPGASTPNPADLTRARPKTPWIVDVLLWGFWKLTHRISIRYQQAREFADTAKRFWSHWLGVAGPLVVARWRRLLHFGSASLAVGATGGMYFRGLFQGYEVIWSSAFITTEGAVSTWLNWVFGPAFFLSSLIGQDLQGKIDVARLLTAEGDPAGPWIHLFGITVVIAVVLPRAALATWQSVRVQKLKNSLSLLFDQYYGGVIESPYKTLIEQEIRKGTGKLSNSVASFVRTQLYDAQIVPQLEAFRENGGKITGLKAQIKETTEAFGPEIKAFVNDRGVPEFQRSVSVGVDKIAKGMETDFVRVMKSEQDLVQIKVGAPGTSADAIGYGYGDTISAAIAASIAVVVGTISGGFGETLELALLTTLLGTTGPIGFLIGALIGIVVAGAGWWLGREKITGVVEGIELPAFVVRRTLWESRFKKLVEDGRQQCYESIRNNVQEQMNPLVPQITNGVMLEVRRLWEV